MEENSLNKLKEYIKIGEPENEKFDGSIYDIVNDYFNILKKSSRDKKINKILNNEISKLSRLCRCRKNQFWNINQICIGGRYKII